MVLKEEVLFVLALCYYGWSSVGSVLHRKPSLNQFYFDKTDLKIINLILIKVVSHEGYQGPCRCLGSFKWSASFCPVEKKNLITELYLAASVLGNQSMMAYIDF